MPTGHNMIGSGRTGRILFEVGSRDLYFPSRSTIIFSGGPFDREFMVQRHRLCGAASCADRKKRIAAERRLTMAKQDRKTIKILEARRIAIPLVGGNKEDADRCLPEVINYLQGPKS